MIGWRYQNVKWSIPKECVNPAEIKYVINPSLLGLMSLLAINKDEFLKYLNKCHIDYINPIMVKKTNEHKILSEVSAIKLIVEGLKIKKMTLAKQSLALSQFRTGECKWLVNVGEMLLAAMNGNSVWLKRSLKHFLNVNPERVLFELTKYKLDEKFKSDLTEMANYIYLQLKDTERQEQFASMISLLKASDADEFNNESVIKMPTLKTIRTQLEKEDQNKIPYWYYVLKNRTTDLEAQNYLEQRIESIEDPEILLWALSILPTPTKYINSKKREILNKITNSGDHYHRVLRLRLYQNEGAKKDFEQIDVLAKLPHFHLQRKLYQEMINDFDVPSYPLHYLLLLNDSNIPANILPKVVP